MEDKSMALEVKELIDNMYYPKGRPHLGEYGLINLAVNHDDDQTVTMKFTSSTVPIMISVMIDKIIDAIVHTFEHDTVEYTTKVKTYTDYEPEDNDFYFDYEITLYMEH